MAAYSLFAEDEICIYKPSKGYTFGIIRENSEFVSSSDDEDEENDDDRIQQGSVKVAWHPSGKEAVIAENKVQLVDRSLMPGDVVRRLIPGQKSQCGFVINMDVRSHLRILRTNKYIYNVDSCDLQLIEHFESGQEVMMDSWLGRVENVIMDAILLFQDGAKCQVDINDLYSFDERTDRHGKFSDSFYYPGQELKGPLATLNDAKWLHSTSKHSHKAATKKGKTSLVNVSIEKIITKRVEVLWIFRGYEKVESPDIPVKPPPRVVKESELDRLVVLDWFSHCSVQIGDRMVYRIKNDDIISSALPGKAYNPKTALSKDCPIKVDQETDNQKEASSLADSTSSQSLVKIEAEDDDAEYIDVEDDEADSDGEEKQGAVGGKNPSHGRSKKKHSTHKGGSANLSRHKLGGQHIKTGSRRVCPKDRMVKADDVVEVEVAFNTSYAQVMWQDGTVERDIPSVELFPVHHLDELEFFPGDYVLPNIELAKSVDYGVLVKADHKERTCIVHWFKAYEISKATKPSLVEQNAELSVYDIKDHPDYKFRPGQSVVRVGGFENLDSDSDVASQAVGQIYELDPNGHLVVKWANGTISQCYPQEVFIVSDEADDSDNESWDTESEYDSEASGDTWETESESEVIGEEGATGDVASCESSRKMTSEEKHRQDISSLLGRAEKALDRLQRLLGGFNVNFSFTSTSECIVDIIRIFRSCHDLDRILQSSFFSSSELQDLMGQAKVELNRDKVHQISQSLAEVFEQRSRDVDTGPESEAASMGTISVAGKTITIRSVAKNGVVKGVNFAVPVGEDKQTMAGVDTNNICPPLDSIGNSDCAQEPVKKREGSVSEASSEEQKTPEPLNDCSSVALNCSAPENQNGASEANVVKAAKRSKSDVCDDFVSEAKKSRDESNKTPSMNSQELCVKICQSLQQQLAKIKDEVNRRANRLLSASEEKTLKNTVSSEGAFREDNFNELEDEDSAATEDLTTDKKKATVSAFLSSPDEEGEQDDPNVNSTRVEPPDSMPQSMDEAGERVHQASTPVLGSGILTQCTEGGDVGRIVEAVRADAGNEASCEESSSQISIVSDEGQSDIGPCKGFEICGEVVSFHKYVAQESQPTNSRLFRNAIRKELKLFQSSLPDGIFVKGFEDRLDLYSVMILGPTGTPYEDALFLFDLMLPNDYPNSPPDLHYYSFCSDRLNPNLYEDGKVCVSLLGTWSGKGSEVWTSKSNLLQVLLSIQGLILVREPYYNEAYYERQRGTQVGYENSRMYNEMAILKTVQSLTRMCQSLPELFKHEIYKYLKHHGPRMITRLQHWLEVCDKDRKKTLKDVQGEAPPSLSNQNPQPSAYGINIPSYLPDSSGNSISSSSIIKGGRGEGEVAGILAGTEDSESISESYPPSSSVDYIKQDEQQSRLSNKPSSANGNCGSQNQIQPMGKLTLVEICGSAVDAPLCSIGNVQAENPPMQLKTAVDQSTLSSASVEGSLKEADKVLTGGSPQVVSSPLSPSVSGSIKEPEFSLFPMSRGFCLTLQKHLGLYEQALCKMKDPSDTCEPQSADNVEEKERKLGNSICQGNVWAED